MISPSFAKNLTLSVFGGEEIGERQFVGSQILEMDTDAYARYT